MESSEVVPASLYGSRYTFRFLRPLIGKALKSTSCFLVIFFSFLEPGIARGSPLRSEHCSRDLAVFSDRFLERLEVSRGGLVAENLRVTGPGIFRIGERAENAFWKVEVVCTMDAVLVRRRRGLVLVFETLCLGKGNRC